MKWHDFSDRPLWKSNNKDRKRNKEERARQKKSIGAEIINDSTDTTNHGIVFN